MINNRKNKKGFTLIELMLVVAIIAILAGIVMIPLSGYRQRAADTKILAELSATIQPLLTCWSDGNNVRFPTDQGTADICRNASTGVIIPEYGQWPLMDSDYLYNWPIVDNQLYDGSVDWSFYIVGNNGEICCNKRNKQCALIPTSSPLPCDNTTDLTRF